jgi:hypothetical protein
MNWHMDWHMDWNSDLNWVWNSDLNWHLDWNLDWNSDLNWVWNFDLVMSKENIHYNLHVILVLVYVSFPFSFIYIYKCHVTTIILFEVFLVWLKSSCVSINILFNCDFS